MTYSKSHFMFNSLFHSISNAHSIFTGTSRTFRAIICIAVAFMLGGCSIEYADPYYGYHDPEKTFATEGFIATMNQGGPFVRHPRKPQRWQDYPAYTSEDCKSDEARPKLLQRLQKAIAKDTPQFAPVWYQQDTRLLLDIPQNSIFFVDAPQLRPDSYPPLDRLVALTRDFKVRVDFVGHTDATGPASYNQSLSSLRALHLQRYFVLKGLPQPYAVSHAMGETAPIASNKTPLGREKNRRVSLIFCTI